MLVILQKTNSAEGSEFDVCDQQVYVEPDLPHTRDADTKIKLYILVYYYIIYIMKKRVRIVVITAGMLLLGVITSGSPSQPSNSYTDQYTNTSSEVKGATEEVRPTCNGTTVTTDCSLDGINYSVYVYHPATPEKSHTETVTAYERVVTGYCTLCSDGTYSPSCATGRGACSHHGGVAQWNAPRYSNVPKYTTKTVIDEPAREAYYEKVVE